MKPSWLYSWPAASHWPGIHRAVCLGSTVAQARPIRCPQFFWTWSSQLLLGAFLCHRAGRLNALFLDAFEVPVPDAVEVPQWAALAWSREDRGGRGRLPAVVPRGEQPPSSGSGCVGLAVGPPGARQLPHPHITPAARWPWSQMSSLLTPWPDSSAPHVILGFHPFLLDTPRVIGVFLPGTPTDTSLRQRVPDVRSLVHVPSSSRRRHWHVRL